MKLGKLEDMKGVACCNRKMLNIIWTEKVRNEKILEHLGGESNIQYNSKMTSEVVGHIFRHQTFVNSRWITHWCQSLIKLGNDYRIYIKYLKISGVRKTVI